MMVNSFEISEALQLIPLAPEKVAEAHQKTDARIWLDLQISEPGELEEWLDKLRVEDLSRRLCLEAGDRSGFYPLKREIFLVIPVLAKTEGPPEVDYVAFVCRENLLLTFHRKPVLDLQELAALEGSDAWLPERSISGLVSALMIDLSLEGLQHTAKLRNSILALEVRMDREPDEIKADEILDIRSELLTLASVVSDQVPSLQALSTIDKPFFKLEDAKDYMTCALVNLRAADGSLDWLDGRISSLRTGFDMHAQEKTNRRLNMLTILSAIFNPATLLAGIWGMNFVTMPELSYPFGYPMALGLIALTGWGMFFYFRRHGWLD